MRTLAALRMRTMHWPCRHAWLPQPCTSLASIIACLHSLALVTVMGLVVTGHHWWFTVFRVIDDIMMTSDQSRCILAIATVAERSSYICSLKL